MARSFVFRYWALLLASYGGVQLLGCNKPTACQTLPDCDDGYECLAFRCVPPGGYPVPPDSQRQLLLPRTIGVEAHSELGARVDLGPPQRSSLYLDFELPRSSCEHLHSAFLLLDADASVQPLAASAELQVRRVTESWSARSVGAGDLPDDSVPEARGLMAPPLTARVDVTRLVCSELEGAAEPYGFVVRSDAEVPVSIATGVESAFSPRLELYLDAPSKQAPRAMHTFYKGKPPPSHSKANGE